MRRAPVLSIRDRPYPVNAGSALLGRGSWAAAHTRLGRCPKSPFFFMGFGANGPKKGAGCGVQPRSATFLRPPEEGSAKGGAESLR